MWSMPGCVGSSRAEFGHEQSALYESWYTNFHTVHYAPVGTLKGKAYANKPNTIQEVENNIRREIAAISEDILQATFANMKRRV